MQYVLGQITLISPHVPRVEERCGGAAGVTADDHNGPNNLPSLEKTDDGSPIFLVLTQLPLKILLKAS